MGLCVKITEIGTSAVDIGTSNYIAIPLVFCPLETVDAVDYVSLDTTHILSYRVLACPSQILV